MAKAFKRKLKKWALVRRDASDEVAEPRSPVSSSPSGIDRTNTERSSDVVGRAGENVSGQAKTTYDGQRPDPAASLSAEPNSQVGSSPGLDPAGPQDASEAQPLPPGPAPRQFESKTIEAMPKASTIPENLKGPGLWEQAYDAFHKSNPMLAGQYEQIVSSFRFLAPEKSEENEDTAFFAESVDVDEFAPAGPMARRVKMSQILDDWLAGKAAPEVGQFQSSDKNMNMSDIFRSFWDIIRPMILETGQASAIAWVASSFAAQALFKSPASVLSGTVGSNFISILCRMGWYCRLQSLLPSEPQASEKLGANASKATKGKSQDPRGALIDMYEAVLSYLIRLACSSHDPGSELQVHDNLYQDIGEKERIFATQLDSWGPAVEKQLRRLAASAARGQPAYSRTGAASGGSQEAGDDAESTSSKLGVDNLGLGSLFDQRPNAADSASVFDGSRLDLELAYKWLTSTSQYAAFRNASGTQRDAKQYLWVTGAPGAGKSMLLKAVVRYKMKPVIHSQEGPDDSYKVASFFCNGGKARAENAGLVVKNLIAQVLKEQPALSTDQTKELVESAGGSELVRPASFHDVLVTFCTMLKHEQFRATCFIVDAIDECSMNGEKAEAERGMNELLALISTTMVLSDKVRWLVSLDFRVANARLASMADASWPLHLDLDSHSNALQAVVHKHIDFKIEGLLRITSSDQGHRYDQDFHNSTHQSLLDKSQENFLWIDLACEIIRGRGSPWNALHILGKLPMGVEALYTYAKEAINLLPMDDHIYCDKVLEAMAITYRPLRISELVDLVDLPPYVDLSIVIAKCSVFLQVHESEVSVVHQSAKDFLRNKIKLPLKVHAEITRLCLAHLSKTLSSTTSPRGTRSEKPAHYATFYWLQHLSVVLDDKIDSKMIDLVAGFLDKYFLQWVEMLAPFPGFSHVLIQMSVLEDKLRAINNNPVLPEVPDLNHATCLRQIQDARRLLRFHVFTKSPPRISLKNSLLFCPQLGSMQQKMLKSEYSWLASARALHVGNSSFTLEGHKDWVRSCGYSRDGRALASCSDDATVRIWDPETGELQWQLTGFGDWVRRVIFSHRGLLATMESDTIKIWDSATYIPLQSFRITELVEHVDTSPDDPEIFRDMAFSIEGDRLAAAAGSSVVIWDMSSYKVTKTLKCADTIRKLRFSRNNQLATTLGDIVVVWGLEDNSMLWKTKSDDSRFSGLCYSPDARWLAVGLENGKVWICDVTGVSDEPTRTFSGHEREVVSVSFSPDGTRLASGSYDITIRLWDVFEGSDDQPGKLLFGHMRDISDVCFSPNGGRLASSSDDATVRVWDMDSQWDNSTVQSGATKGESALKHTQGISFITVSTDGSLIASGSEDGLICLWDGHTGDFRASLQEHTSEILWLAFSVDGRRLSSTSRAGDYVAIWDTKDAKLLHTLNEHYDWVRCAVFSPDPEGRLLASTSDDTCVRIWNLARAGELGKRNIDQPEILLRGHTDYVICASFSTDGRYLASGGDDRIVRVWDLTQQALELESNAKNTNGDGKGNDNNNDNNDHDNDDDDKQSTSHTLEEDTPHRSLHRNQFGRIIGITLSTDDQQVIASSEDGAITIWDLTLHSEEQQPKKQYPDFGKAFNSLCYSPAHPYWILTETGAHLLVESTNSPPPAEWTKWHLSNKRDWILHSGQERIFLPVYYRPGRKTVRVQGGRVVVGCPSGYIIVFRVED